LINLGSPRTPAVPDVRQYLNEFLMDGYVLDAPWPIRRMIVSLFILPFRPKKSAEAYASIWTEHGSPLRHHSRALVAELGKQVTEPIALAMRYGNPSIADGVDELLSAGVEHIVIAPLYPQFADSTVTTCIEAARKAIGTAAQTSVLPPFYANADYIEALRRTIAAHLPEPVDHVLFSYHGLPERHLTRTDPTGEHCLKRPDCCNTPSTAHATCYRHQAFETTRLVTEALGLEADRYSMSFQSRLGRLPWLTPYTDERLVELAEAGVRKLAVVCPAFVADNLETLEEIGIQGRDTFVEAGGEELTLVPCLNEDTGWAAALAGLLGDQTTAASAETSA
jgi:ferrochelatase